VLDGDQLHASRDVRVGEPDRRLRLVVFVSKELGRAPGQRFRLEQWAPRLARDYAIDLEFVPYESPALTEILSLKGHTARKAYLVLRDFARRARPVLASRRFDAAIVFREIALLGPAIYERALSALGVPFFFDYDDAIWFNPQIKSEANGIFARLHFYGKAATICRLASGVFAGNEYLAAYARRWTRNVHVVPTSIELDTYAMQPALPHDAPFTIGWSGSLSTLSNFECARAALERLAARRPIRVRVICNRPPSRPIAGAENVFVPWSEHREVEELGACHVGIMPLPDEEFTRGKCGLKALQFMAVGRPVVISPVGMNADLIRQGVNGYLAATDDAWLEAFEVLAASAAERERIGIAARRTVEKGYSAEVVSKSVAHIVRETLRAHDDVRAR